MYNQQLNSLSLYHSFLNSVTLNKCLYVLSCEMHTELGSCGYPGTHCVVIACCYSGLWEEGTTTVI